jgi:hypothetical protein
MKMARTAIMVLACLFIACASASKKPPIFLRPPPARTAVGPTGPTLLLDYGKSTGPGNSISAFMYFVPLISPEPVSIAENPGNTQQARVLQPVLHTTADSFSTVCEFVITGSGVQRNVFDLAGILRRNSKKLEEGGTLERQLDYINVTGPGHGSVEVEGSISNGVPVVSVVRLHFAGHGQPSPVTIGLEDIRSSHGQIQHQNELVAQVETLTFRRAPGPAKMEVTVGSVKHKDAGNGLWQRFVGNVTGAAANLLLKPLTVESGGHKAMLDFGLALVLEQPRFTFPQAKNLRPEPKSE